MGGQWLELPYPLPERRRRTPGFPRKAPVAHAMTVCAQARELFQSGFSGPHHMEGCEVMHFDVAVSQIAAVDEGEVEVADLAPERAAALAYLLDLQSPQFRVPLSGECATDKKASLDGCGAGLVYLVWFWRKPVELARPDAFLDRLGSLKHLRLALHEGVDHEPGRLATAGGLAGVLGVVRHEVGGLVAHAARRAETRQSPDLRRMDRQRTQQLRQLSDLVIVGSELAPVVLHHKRADQYKLILSPGRDPHEQYRMSVRRGGGCVRRTAQRAAHLVGSRCQWGLSPSVMVDCKMSLPLYGCKEGA